MRTLTPIALFGLLALVAAAGCATNGSSGTDAGGAETAASPAPAKGSHLITFFSDREVDDVVARVDAECKKHGFGVLGVKDLQATLKKKGFDLARETKLMDVCKPPAAHKILTEHPPIVTVLPCRIAVYAGDDGRTVVQCVKPIRLLGMFDSPGCSEAAGEVDIALRQIMEAAAAQ